MKGLNRTKLIKEIKHSSEFWQLLVFLSSFQSSQGCTSEVSRQNRRHRCPEEAHLK